MADAVEVFETRPWPKPEMPLGEFLDVARNYNQVVLMERKYGDPFLSPLFVFIRFAKGHPALKGASAMEALKRVEGWLSAKRHKNVDEAWIAEFRSDQLFSAEDARAEFLDLWDRVKFPAGYSPLDAAWENAQNRRLRLGGSSTVGYGKFISLAEQLQLLRGEQTILLPCRKVAELLGCLPNTVSRYRQWAVRDELLTIVSKHSFRDRDATEFKFDLARIRSR